MYRCLQLGRRAAAAVCVMAGAAYAVPASAQLVRNFPETALRGAIVFVQPPDITLNGQEARLAPGARVRGQDNMVQLSGALAGSKWIVHYTVDLQGQVRDVWLLRPEEIAATFWPRTPAEAQRWAFDAATQTWSRP